MFRSILTAAILTGIFCSAFAVAIDVFTDMLDRTNVILASFASGFFGSLIAQTVLGRWKENRKLALRRHEK